VIRTVAERTIRTAPPPPFPSDTGPAPAFTRHVTMAMLDVSGLTKNFGGFTAIKDVCFTVEQGEILGLIGPNGSGKSTTFNCIAGMYAPTAGAIALDGEPIGGLAASQVCHMGIGRTYQIPRPFRNLSILENVALSAYFGQARAVTRAVAWDQAREAIEIVGLPTGQDARTEGLGAAALKKLELARALATQPRLLLADESLNGLDHSEMEQAADMLERVRSEKKITIVWVEHIMGVLMRVVDRVVVLDHGEVIFDGLPRDAQTDKRVVEVYLGSEPVPGV
jgi:branched-chain amino acid transport system ATP-binding protein